MAKYSLYDLKDRFNTHVFTNLLQLITGKLLNGILHDIVDSVVDWLNSYVLKSDCRKGVVDIPEGEYDIEFTTPFPEGTQYAFTGQPFCFDNEGLIAFTISNITVSGFTINAVAAGKLHYKVEKL